MLSTAIMINISDVTSLSVASSTEFHSDLYEDHHEDETNTHDHEHAKDHEPLDIVLSVFSILVANFICFGNSVTLVAIGRNFKLKTIPNMYIASLAVADLMVGLMSLIQGISSLDASSDLANENEHFCLILMSMLFVSVTASMLSSMMVAFDRYTYIMYSIKYAQLVTKEKSACIILIMWLMAGAYGTVPLYTSNFSAEGECTPTHVFDHIYMIIVHPTLFFTICGITFFLYLRIALTAVSQQKRIQIQEASVSVETRGRNVSKRTWRVVKLLMVVFGLFFISWCPLLIIAILEYTVHVSHDALAAGSLIAIMNSGINFLVLGYLNKDFKLEFRQMLCVCFGRVCCCCRNTNVIPTGVSTIVSNGESFHS